MHAMHDWLFLGKTGEGGTQAAVDREGNHFTGTEDDTGKLRKV